MTTGIVVATGCLLQIVEATFTPTDTGWTERTHIEVVADPSCGWVDLSLTSGGTLGKHKAIKRPADGGRKKLGEERWVFEGRAVDGTGNVRLHLPDVRWGGDRAILTVTRHHPAGPITFVPGAAKFVAVAVDGAGSVVSSASPGVRTTRTWTTNTTPDHAVQVDAIGQQPPSEAAFVWAPGEVRVDQRLQLLVPQGDPMTRLYPGGGSSVIVEEYLQFPASDRLRAWPLTLPAGAVVENEVTPAGAATLQWDGIEGGAGARLVLPPSEATVRVTVRHSEADAPVMGSKPQEVHTLSVDVPRGEVRWEGDSWYLAGVNEAGVTPPREVLAKALDRRFRTGSLREPSAPLELRGRTPSWELAAELRPVLLDRSAIGLWPADPLWPRNLLAARRSGAFTPTEAALTLWMAANQLGLRADWVLVKPAADGRAPTRVPTGISAALVRIELDGEARFIDPTCTVCGPFELPPGLEGAAAFGLGITTTPPPRRGRQVAEVTEQSVTWTLEGPAALALRLWLQGTTPDDRSRALAEHVGGVGATLQEVVGLEQAGAHIRVQTTRGHGALPHPLTTPPVPDDEGATVWFDWMGERTVIWPDHELPDASVDAPAATYHRRRLADGEGVVETLVVLDREVPAWVLRQIDAARAGVPTDAALETAP